MEKQTENARLVALDEGEEQEGSNTSLPVRQAQRKRDAESDAARIFHRAARIIRQSTEADGVVFFDTSAAGIRTHLYDYNRSAASSDESATHNTDTGDSTASRRPKKQTAITADGAPEASGADSKACPVVGLSLREGNAALVHTDFSFNEAAMERYIHRYPYGKFFNYNEDGIAPRLSSRTAQWTDLPLTLRSRAKSEKDSSRPNSSKSCPR